MQWQMPSSMVKFNQTNQGNGDEVPLAKRSRMPTTILNLLATWQIKLRGLLDKA
jgi:hypothetical protein